MNQDSYGSAGPRARSDSSELVQTRNATTNCRYYLAALPRRSQIGANCNSPSTTVPVSQAGSFHEATPNQGRLCGVHTCGPPANETDSCLSPATATAMPCRSGLPASLTVPPNHRFVYRSATVGYIKTTCSCQSDWRRNCITNHAWSGRAGGWKAERWPGAMQPARATAVTHGVHTGVVERSSRDGCSCPPSRISSHVGDWSMVVVYIPTIVPTCTPAHPPTGLLPHRSLLSTR